MSFARPAADGSFQLHSKTVKLFRRLLGLAVIYLASAIGLTLLFSSLEVLVLVHGSAGVTGIAWLYLLVGMVVLARWLRVDIVNFIFARSMVQSLLVRGVGVLAYLAGYAFLSYWNYALFQLEGSLDEHEAIRFWTLVARDVLLASLTLLIGRQYLLLAAGKLLRRFRRLEIVPYESESERPQGRRRKTSA